MPRGGYQQPSNPAAVSGPGALSARTDGAQAPMNIPAASYGDATQTASIQSGAPMAAAQPIGAPSAPSGGGGAPAPDQPLPLGAGSILPSQPVTHGADSGPGPDSSSLGLGDPTVQQHASALSLVQSLATQPNASPQIQFLASQLAGGF